MKVRDLLNMQISCDVYDNVHDTLGIGFEGKQRLTREGEREWKTILDLEVELKLGWHGYLNAIVIVDNDKDFCELNAIRVREFFTAIAGYVPESDWYKWFYED